jgi:hypothetical protein
MRHAERPVFTGRFCFRTFLMPGSPDEPPLNVFDKSKRARLIFKKYYYK